MSTLQRTRAAPSEEKRAPMVFNRRESRPPGRRARRVVTVRTWLVSRILDNFLEAFSIILGNSRESADEEPIITFSPGRLFSIGKKRLKAGALSFPTLFSD